MKNAVVAICNSSHFRPRSPLNLAVVSVSSVWVILLVQVVQAPNIEAHGIIDWTGHLLTALIIALGLWALRLPFPIWSVLIGGLVPDFGHILTFLDLADPIKGSSRNGSHSLTTVAVIVLIAVIDRRRAGIWLGIAIGAITHLWRDMGTGAVPLFWPLSHSVWSVSFTWYVVTTFAVGLAMIAIAALRPSPVPQSPQLPDPAPQITVSD